MSDEKVFEVQPVPLVVVNGFRISNVNVKVGQNSATITVHLLNNGEILQTKYLIMSGNDYKNWSDDYPYVTNWICTQLGFTLV